MTILTADIHLTDLLQDAYRWIVFDELLTFCEEENDYEIIFLGDLCDRKDRHSAVLVNRLIKHLGRLVKAGCSLQIIMGNHDMPIAGSPFWSFLNNLPGLKFYTKPIIVEKVALFPFTNDFSIWADLVAVSDIRFFCIHQPMYGAMLENGRTIQGATLDDFGIPKNIPIYAGDIHTPQQIGNLVYVGAPHPIKFGDNYKCRMLRVNDKGKIIKVRKLNYMQRHMLDITKVFDLPNITEGDQVKVRFHMDASHIAYWPMEREAIEAWAKMRKVELMSVEAIVELGERKEGAILGSLSTNPQDVLAAYAEGEDIPTELLEVGQDILRSMD